VGGHAGSLPGIGVERGGDDSTFLALVPRVAVIPAEAGIQ
jgi:hypothetical protein